MEIVPRNEWCTTPRTGMPSPIPTKLPRRWLHHGASGTSSIATANAYARWHILHRPPPRWIDVGYSWIVAEGKVLEARGPGRQGAHTYSDNRLSYGVCLAGDYSSRQPADRDLDALVWLLRHGVSRGWWDVPEFTGGHRDAPGASTSCPGDRLHRLIGDINKAAVSKPQPAPVEDDDMARSMLTRISNSDAVYQIAGRFLIPVISPSQAAIIVQHAGLEPGKTAAQIDSGNLWQRHVGNLSKGEAGHFIILSSFDTGGGGLTQGEADARYARRSHSHSATIDLT